MSALMSSSRCFNCVRTGICDVLYLHSMSSHTAESAPSRRQRRLCAGCGPLTRWFRRCPSSSQRSLIHHVSSWTTIRHDNTQHVTNTRRRHRRRSCRHSHPSEFIFIALDSRHARQRATSSDCRPTTVRARRVITTCRYRQITALGGSAATPADMIVMHFSCYWHLLLQAQSDTYKKLSCR